LFERVDRAVEEAGVGDGMAARVAGFPYLRASRFLASYTRNDLSEAQFDQWVGRMMTLGREAHRVELANLPAANRVALGHPPCTMRWSNARGGSRRPTGHGPSGGRLCSARPACPTTT
jgi:hypothetical protein